MLDGQGLVDVALGILRSHPYGFLATRAVDGGSSVRLVQHLRVDDDATIWIGTSPRSRKVQEIEGHAQVSYSVEQRESFAYATVAGPATIVGDVETRAELWEEGLRAFFPAGPEGDDFVVVRFRSQRIEMMDFAGSIHPQPYGLVPAVIERDGSTWRVAAAERRPGPVQPET